MFKRLKARYGSGGGQVKVGDEYDAFRRYRPEGLPAQRFGSRSGAKSGRGTGSYEAEQLLNPINLKLLTFTESE